MNCDVSQNSSKSPYGIILRDAKCDVLVYRNGNLLMDSTLATKDYALLLGVKLISSKGWSNVSVESGCRQLILVLLDLGVAPP